MSFLRRLRDRGRRAEMEDGRGPLHLDPELESRLPAAVLGQELDRVSQGTGTLDEDAQWWFRGITDALGVPPDRLTVAVAGRPDDPRAIQGIRVRGCTPHRLQVMLDQEAWIDRALAGGDEMVLLGGLRLRRGVSGNRSYTDGPDGAPAPSPDEVIDPSRVFYQLQRGDGWFNIFAAEDLEWTAAAAAAISGGAALAPAVSVSLPEAWIGGPLEGMGSAALADRIERRLAAADSTAREAWDGVLGKLRPKRFARPYASGTRYVAYDLGQGPVARKLSGLEIREYLAPYGSLDEELRLELEEGELQVIQSGPVEHPLGPAHAATARFDADGEPGLVRLWLIRPGPVAYRLIFFSFGSATDATLEQVARIARSLAVGS